MGEEERLVDYHTSPPCRPSSTQKDLHTSLIFARSPSLSISCKSIQEISMPISIYPYEGTWAVDHSIRYARRIRSRNDYKIESHFRAKKNSFFFFFRDSNIWWRNGIVKTRSGLVSTHIFFSRGCVELKYRASVRDDGLAMSPSTITWPTWKRCPPSVYS